MQWDKIQVTATKKYFLDIWVGLMSRFSFFVFDKINGESVCFEVIVVKNMLFEIGTTLNRKESNVFDSGVLEAFSSDVRAFQIDSIDSFKEKERIVLQYLVPVLALSMDAFKMVSSNPQKYIYAFQLYRGAGESYAQSVLSLACDRMNEINPVEFATINGYRRTIKWISPHKDCLIILDGKLMNYEEFIRIAPDGGIFYIFDAAFWSFG